MTDWLEDFYEKDQEEFVILFIEIGIINDK